MLSSYLFYSLIISIISTGSYAVITSDKGDISYRKSEYCTIACIIMIVSVIILFISSGNKTEIVPVNMDKVSMNGNLNKQINNTPPF